MFMAQRVNSHSANLHFALLLAMQFFNFTCYHWLSSEWMFGIFFLLNTMNIRGFVPSVTLATRYCNQLVVHTQTKLNVQIRYDSYSKDMKSGQRYCFRSQILCQSGYFHVISSGNRWSSCLWLVVLSHLNVYVNHQGLSFQDRPRCSIMGCTTIFTFNSLICIL